MATQIGLTGKILSALRRDSVAYLSWSPWPQGGDIEVTAELTGFGAAIRSCIAYIGGEPNWQILRNDAPPDRPRNDRTQATRIRRRSCLK